MTVTPGLNTLSAAASAASGPICYLALEGGATYTQTEPVLIPPHVRHLAIIGPSSAVTKLVWTSAAAGIASQRTLAAKLRQVHLAGFEMEYQASQPTTTAALDFTGSSYNNTDSPGVIIDDVRVRYGVYGRCWRTGLRLTNARVGNISKLFIRQSPSGNVGTAIELHSCLNIKMDHLFVMGCEVGLDMLKAPDHLIDDPAMHGCEDVCVDQSTIFIVDYAVRAGHRCSWTKISNSELEWVRKGGFVETYPPGQFENGGYHTLEGNYFGAAPGANAPTLIDLNRPGTYVGGWNTFFCHGAGPLTAVNLGPITSKCRVEGNLFRFNSAGGTAIAVRGQQNDIGPNTFEASAVGATDVLVAAGADRNSVTAGPRDIVTNLGTNTAVLP